MNVRAFSWAATVLLAAVAGTWLVPAAAGAEAPPAVSEDGLELTKSTRTRLVYVRPGASLAQYRRLAILDCHVEFEKDWQRDYNRSVAGLQGRVSDKDVERMKRDLAAECKKVFTKELQEKGGYEVVEVTGPDVLILRPALINVEVSAPDLMTPGIGGTIVRSAGQMTLYLELWDSDTKAIMARVLDAKADPDSMAERASRVTNAAAADRILRSWAKELHDKLDDARSAAP